MEAVKVRIQTQPGWANTLREGVPKLYGQEGLSGYEIMIIICGCDYIMPYQLETHALHVIFILYYIRLYII